MSSNAIQTPALRGFIQQDIVAALGKITVSFGKPRTPLVPPYVIVVTQFPEIVAGGRLGRVKGPTQENTFNIMVVKPWPASGLIIEQEEADANALIAQFQANNDYHGIGKFPLVTGGSFGENVDPNERVHVLMVTFTVATWASYTNEPGI